MIAAGAPADTKAPTGWKSAGQEPSELASFDTIVPSAARTNTWSR